MFCTVSHVQSSKLPDRRVPLPPPVTDAATSTQQVKEMEVHERIINSILPQFHYDTGRLRGNEKLKVLQAANVTNQELNKTLNMLKEIQKLHSWLRKRAESGKTLPTTQSDMIRMMMDPDGGMSKKIRM